MAHTPAQNVHHSGENRGIDRLLVFLSGALS
jgi:hypothetical protein